MGQVFVRRRDLHTLCCRFVGVIDGDDVCAAATALESLLVGPAEGHVIVVMETTEMNGFGPDVRDLVVALLQRLRDAGVELVIGVAHSVFARLTGRAFALSAGIPLRVTHTEAETDDVIAAALLRRRRHRAS